MKCILYLSFISFLFPLSSFLFLLSSPFSAPSHFLYFSFSKPSCSTFKMSLIFVLKVAFVEREKQSDNLMVRPPWF